MREPTAPTWPDGVPRLTDATGRRVLERLRVVPAPASADYLRRLQWRWLQTHAFHNIELLAGARTQSAPVTASAIAVRTDRGTGGPCHVQAVGFVAFLRWCGFQVSLAAATIGAPGDHLVASVQLPNATFIADVGNGHPYRLPFPLDRELAQAHRGWRFRSEPHEGGLRLIRYFDTGSTKRVYDVVPVACAFADFQQQIAAHHREPGFGPFLTGLRAVRMHDAVVVTLRDDCYERWSAAGVQRRTVRSRGDCLELLRTVFGLGDLPLEDALDTLCELGAPPWTAAAPHRRRERRVFVTCSTTDRPAALRRLVDGLREDVRGATDVHVELFVVENGIADESRSQSRDLVDQPSAPLHAVHYVDDRNYGRSIAASRRAQVRAVARSLDATALPDVIWMLDDDLLLEQLALDDEGGATRRRHYSCVSRWLELRDENPQVSLAIGGVTGDPPIRPDAMLLTQLVDLAVNIERFAALQPEGPCPPPEDLSTFELPDYYYDLSRDHRTHLERTAPCLPRRELPNTVRAQAIGMLREARYLSSGRAVTRPLLLPADWRNTPLAAGTRRGGNAAFFDVDAFLSHTYPEAECSGARTRRADMIGASRLQAQGLWQVREAELRVHHERTPADRLAGFHDGQLEWDALKSSMVGEFFGVMLARLCIEESNTPADRRIRDLARDRAARIVGNLEAIAERLDALQYVCREPPGWLGADVDAVTAMRALDDVLTRLSTELLGGQTPNARRERRELVQAMLLDESSLATIVATFEGLERFEAEERAAIDQILCQRGAVS